MASNYEITRDALMIAASSHLGNSPEEIIKIAGRFAHVLENADDLSDTTEIDLNGL